MAEFRQEIDAALLSTDPISKDKFLEWVATTTDLLTLSKLYKMSGEGYYRIQPELGGEAACGLIQRYLLECMKQDVKDHEEILGRWDAAHQLHVWFCRLHDMGEDRFLQNAAQAITGSFIDSDQSVRDAIEMGFLEHALETVALRRYFEHWASDDRLREAWSNALAWGEAHPDFMRGMYNELRKLQKSETPE